MEDSKLEWNEISKKEILQTPVFCVTERKSQNAQGASGNYIVLEARDWACVIPVLENDFLMVKQWRHGQGGLSVEFPGGVIETGEKPEEGARRELMEETGYVAKTLVHLGSVNPNPALFANRFHVFLAKGLQKSCEQNLDSDEVLNFLRVPQKEVFKKMGGSEYPHALMCAALELYRQHISD